MPTTDRRGHQPPSPGRNPRRRRPRRLWRALSEIIVTQGAVALRHLRRAGHGSRLRPGPRRRAAGRREAVAEGRKVMVSVTSDRAQARPARPRRRVGPAPAARSRSRRPPHHRRRLGQGRRRQVHRRRQPCAGASPPRACASASSTPISTVPRSRSCSASRASPRCASDGIFSPHEAFGLKVMSIGSMLTPDQAVVWRGPMATSALRQLLRESDWGELDVLVVDLPPGHRRHPDLARASRWS